MDEPVERSKAPARNTMRLAEEIPSLSGPCVACPTCHGVCPEIIEVLTLPRAVLKRGRSANRDGNE